MAGTTKEQLKKEIKEILKDADLSTLSAKKVRQQLEEKLSCDLTGRKKEVDALVMDYVNAQEENNEESEKSKSSEEESEPEPEPEEKKTKRTAAARKTPAKKAKVVKSTESSGEEENASASASDEEYSPKKGAPKPKKKAGRRKKGSDSDSDEDWKKPKPAKKAGGGKGKGTGFTRAYTLSPELAALMGAESLPRHEVVKKMWAIIKEKNLYDPKNKQYAICDSDLIKVIGVKRFRTFGMLKYLRSHFID